MNIYKQFEAVLDECDRWGVEVLYEWPQSIDGFKRPFFQPPACNKTSGISRRGQIVVSHERGTRSSVLSLLHELTHVIAWREVGENPDKVDEAEYMPGLEIEAYRRLKLGFDAPPATEVKIWLSGSRKISSASYSDLSAQARAEAYKRSLLLCERHDLMRGGRPTYKYHYTFSSTGSGRRVRRRGYA